MTVMNQTFVNALGDPRPYRPGYLTLVSGSPDSSDARVVTTVRIALDASGIFSADLAATETGHHYRLAVGDDVLTFSVPAAGGPFAIADYLVTTVADPATLYTDVSDLLVAGDNVTLTGDDAARTITVASTGGGGGTSLDALTEDWVGASARYVAPGWLCNTAVLSPGATVGYTSQPSYMPFQLRESTTLHTWAFRPLSAVNATLHMAVYTADAAGVAQAKVAGTDASGTLNTTSTVEVVLAEAVVLPPGNYVLAWLAVGTTDYVAYNLRGWRLVANAHDAVPSTTSNIGAVRGARLAGGATAETSLPSAPITPDAEAQYLYSTILWRLDQ